MVVKPLQHTLLENLVSQINTENMHTEVDTGESVGNEEW